jgi:hypothetical protein
VGLRTEPVDPEALADLHTDSEELRTGLEEDRRIVEAGLRIAEAQAHRIALVEDPIAAEGAARTLVAGTADHLVGGSQKGVEVAAGLHRHSSRQTAHGLRLGRGLGHRECLVSVRRGRNVCWRWCIPAGLSEGLSFLSSSSSNSFIFFLRKSMVGSCDWAKVE